MTAGQNAGDNFNLRVRRSTKKCETMSGMTPGTDDNGVTALRLAEIRLDCDDAEIPFRIPDDIAVTPELVADLIGLLIGAMAKNGLLESLLTEEQRAEYVGEPGPAPSYWRDYVRGELQQIMANAMLGQLDPGS